MILIFPQIFRFVKKPFFTKAKIHSLAQIPVDYFSYSIISASFVHFGQFAAFAYHVINSFISVIIYTILDILLCAIDSCLD